MATTANDTKAHGWTAKILHWATGGLLAYGYLTGINDIEELTDPATFQTEIIFTAVLAIIFVARFIWMRFVNGATRLPKEAPTWEHQLSRLAHIGIYGGVGAIILTGFAIAWGLKTALVGDLFVSIMSGLHEFAVGVTAVLLGAHILAAIWHKYVRRDGVWESMMPYNASGTG